jgi:uncharacterized protein YbbC (DUF1343 family)
MNTINTILIVIFLSLNLISCCQKPVTTPETITTSILPGAYNTSKYLGLLKGKSIGIVANHTSTIKTTHLVDTLLSLNINIVKIFGPEHGFRGNHPDGKEISNYKDTKTGIDVISLYGNHKKPSSNDLQNIDIMLFDIQDVGARFYTYISTLAYVMEACAENNIPLIILDRPNPNGYYIDGPVLEPAFSSFVGLHPVPIVYGMTIGEYATMVNGEKWLNGSLTCDLTVIRCSSYTHNSRYQLPVKPSPNLQDMEAVYLYSSLCLFEGTVMSVGRGTATPFKVIGHPLYLTGSYDFTPQPIKGVSDNPPLMGQHCYGNYLGSAAELIKNDGRIYLFWLLTAHKVLGANLKGDFFTPYFDKLAGNSSLREQIIAGKNEEEIRASWQPGLEQFKKIRKKYLLYSDFK